MNNFISYIVKNKDGKILDPSFVMGQLDTIHLLEEKQAFSLPMSEFIQLIHDTEEDAELTITWYVRACELVPQGADKLHVEKIQLTVIGRDV